MDRSISDKDEDLMSTSVRFRNVYLSTLGNGSYLKKGFREGQSRMTEPSI